MARHGKAFEDILKRYFGCFLPFRFPVQSPAKRVRMGEDEQRNEVRFWVYPEAQDMELARTS